MMLELLIWTAGASKKEDSPQVGSDIFLHQPPENYKFWVYPEAMWLIFSWQSKRGWVGSECDLCCKKLINLGICLCQRCYLCHKEEGRPFVFLKLHLRQNLTLHISFLLWLWISTILVPSITIKKIHTVDLDRNKNVDYWLDC